MLLPFFLLLLVTATGHSETQSGFETPIWTVDLPHRCTNPDCEVSSPVVADITGDNIPDIVLATSNGHIIAVRHDGALLWDRDTAPHFGMAANTQHINSSPAVADINNDGHMEIVVGVGTIDDTICTQGGVIAYDHNGNFLWRFLTQDEYVDPEGCRDSVFSTPAIGDLDNDGNLEIVVGGFDKRIYVLRHNGALHNHFPVDSHHSFRFPDWNWNGRLADTIWGSASLADVNGDGYLDILISTDEGDYDDNFLPAKGWDCPYAMPPQPWPTNYCGGALYVLDRFGNQLPGFPKRILEIMQSSTAVVDIDGDGLPEIFAGGGTFYHNYSPDHPTIGFRIFGWDNHGNELPGWAGGKVTGGATPASIAVGDIAGDDRPEVVALSMNHKIYAWFADGSAVPGFPMTPRNIFGKGNPFDVGQSPILGDYTGNGKMEIFVRTGANVTIVNGSGQQLTGMQNPPTAPAFYTNSIMQNNAALADIDNDGKLELIAFNSTLYAWDLPNAGSTADWPMFRYNAARTGHPIQPMLLPSATSLLHWYEIDNSDDVQLTLTLHKTGDAPLDWTAVADNSVTLSPASGRLGNAPTAVNITISRPSLNPGANQRAIIFTGTIGGDEVVNSPVQVNIIIHLVDDIYQTHLPFVVR